MPSDRGKPIELRRRLLRRFYEPVLLLNALGQVRGSRIKTGPAGDATEMDQKRLRRSFVDGIAYICAYRKHPDYVTAAALQRTSEGLTVWLAANTDVEPNVVGFLEEILKSLFQISVQDDASGRAEAGQRIRRDLTRKIIAFNAPRVEEYYKQVRKSVLELFDIISKASQKDLSDDTTKVIQLKNWLFENFVSRSTSKLAEEELYAFIETCHAVRKSAILDSLQLFTGQDQTRHGDFGRLYKLLCKISKHVSITKKLIDAVVSLPQDFGQGFTVETIPSSSEQKLPLFPRETSVNSIVGRMFSRPEEQERFLTRIQTICEASELSAQLKKETTTKLRVHAELLLLNHFELNGYSFLDGSDKYIGCSKPACYLCYIYIENHPGRYALPASHQKLYLSWRLPDIHSSESNYESRVEMQEKILLKMIDKVRYDLQTDMKSREPPRPYHADSTAGETSVVEPSAAIFSLPASLSLDATQSRNSNLPIANSRVQDMDDVEFNDGLEDEDEGGVMLT